MCGILGRNKGLLKRVGRLLRSSSSEHVPIVPADGSISRVVSLQRQLLARETQLAAAQQTALRWRGEKADLERRLSATYAQVKQAQAHVEQTQAHAIAESLVADEASNAKLAALEQAHLEAVTSLEAEARAFKESLQQAHEAATTSEKARHSAEAENKLLREQLERAQTEASRLGHAYASAEEFRKVLEQKLEESTQRIKAEQLAARESLERSNQQRPLRIQREREALQQDKEALQAVVAEQSKKLALQQRRAADAESRMEGLQKEVVAHRASSHRAVARALSSSIGGDPSTARLGSGMPSPRGGVSPSFLSSPRARRRIVQSQLQAQTRAKDCASVIMAGAPDSDSAHGTPVMVAPNARVRNAHNELVQASVLVDKAQERLEPYLK